MQQLRRRKLKRVLITILMLSVLAGTMSISAAAASVSGKQGEALFGFVYMDEWYDREVSNVQCPGLPEGLLFTTGYGRTDHFEGDKKNTIYVSGVPKVSGTFNLTVSFSIGAGEFAGASSGTAPLTLVIAAADPTPSPTPSPAPKPTPTKAPAQTPTAKPGQNPTKAPVQTATPKPGASTAPASATPAAPVTLPPPTDAPTLKPAVGAVQISLNPRDVTVEVGGSCEFTANATNYTWCAWRFVSADGQREIIFDVIGNNFPGLTVTGGNFTTFKLSNVPEELNGWQAVCMFGDNFSRVTTTGAKITVTPRATATPEPTATPSPSPEPTATPSPEPTATPVPTEAPTETPVPTATPEPEPEPKVGGNFLKYILIGGGALLVLAIVISVIVTVRKRKRARDFYDDY